VACGAQEAHCQAGASLASLPPWQLSLTGGLLSVSCQSESLTVSQEASLRSGGLSQEACGAQEAQCQGKVGKAEVERW
jgi:hypothetical protein